MGNTEEDRPCNILIVGDWFVDEYWFLVRHYSDISSHTGPLHYRIYSEPKEHVKDLCGAGLVAQVLYRLRKYTITNELFNQLTGLNQHVNSSVQVLEKENGVPQETCFSSLVEKFEYHNHKKLISDSIKKVISECLTTIRELKLPDDTIQEIEKMIDEEFSAKEFLQRIKKEIIYKRIFQESYESLISDQITQHHKISTEFLQTLNPLKESGRLNNDVFQVLEGMVEQKYDNFLDKFKESLYKVKKFADSSIQENIDSIKKEIDGIKYESLILKNTTKSYNLFGLGNWYKDDTEIIKHLIHAKDKKDGGYAALASFCLEPQKCKDEVDITLGTLRPDYPTIRVIRQYHLEGNEFKQTNRIDWEPKLDRDQEEGINLSNLPLPNNVDAIVIEDHIKGVVDLKNLIEPLKKKYSNAKWYIRSKRNIRSKRKKEELKELLKLIAEQTELLVLGPEVASRSYPCEALLVNKTKITRQAFDLIKDIKDDPKVQKINNIILLSDKREVLAVLSNNKCIAGKSSKTSTQLSQVGWATAFFASLIHETYKKGIEGECQGKNIEKDNIENAIKNADELSGVSVPESIRLNEESKTEESDEQSKPDVKVPLDTWDDIANKWQQAMGKGKKEGCLNEIETYGIITKENGNKVLEVWRGSTDLPEYVVWIEQKRKYIKQIWQKLREFKTAGDIKRPLGILLYADPAAGKSFLAAKLSDRLDFKFIHRDITQMIHRDNLLDLFDDIATAQAEKGSRVLVFVDEINARLEGNHVYGAFLTPIESGYYIRRGVKFKLKPCVWIFAGTKSASKEEEKKEEKLPDFKSRMTIIVDMDYKSLEEKYKNEPGVAQLKKEAKLEQVYIGAIKIRDHFPDVSKVSEAILEEFYKLDPSKNPYREIRKLAASLQNVQYGIVKRKNCTSYEWEERLGSRHSSWLEEEKKEDFIELIFAHRPEREK